MVYINMAVCQNLVPLVNIKIAGKCMFIPLKMVSIGIDPYPYHLFLESEPTNIHRQIIAVRTCDCDERAMFFMRCSGSFRVDPGSAGIWVQENVGYISYGYVIIQLFIIIINKYVYINACISIFISI